MLCIRRWEVQCIDAHGSLRDPVIGFDTIGAHFSKQYAMKRAEYLQEVSGYMHRVVDRRMF